jgi:thioredoxin-like negative regulator of GroEL
MITSLFRAATDLDPTNPRAYAGLAHSLIFQGLLGPLRIPDAYHSATVAAEFAARLAASDAWIKSPVAWLKVVHERDWEQAYILFNEMLCCDDPSNVACTGFCLLLVAAGQLERAADLLFLAAHRFALSTAYRGLHCWTDYLARDFVQVEEHITQSRLAAQDGDTIGHIEALLLLQTNTPEEALPKLNAMHLRRRDHPLHRAAIAHALAKTGQTKEAGQILDQLRQHRSHGHRIPHYSIAIVLIALKRYEEAVRALEKSYQVGSLFSLGFHADPILEPLHSRADFQAFIRRAYPLNLEFS